MLKVLDSLRFYCPNGISCASCMNNNQEFSEDQFLEHIYSYKLVECPYNCQVVMNYNTIIHHVSMCEQRVLECKCGEQVHGRDAYNHKCYVEKFVPYLYNCL